MSDANRYYEILELESGASQERVKQAYRDLVKVWHPDRFSHDPRLQLKAQERLKEINEAYEQLRAFHPDSPIGTPSGPERERPPEPWATRKPAPRSRRSRTRRVVLVGAVSALFIFLIFLVRQGSRFEQTEEGVQPGTEQRGIPVTEKISPQELRTRGLSFYSAKDYLQALPYFQEAVGQDPRHAETWYQVGYCNYKLGRYRKAARAFQKAIRLEPGDAKAHHGLGRTYSEQRRFQDAVLAFQEAIRLKPEYAEAYKNLGLVYAKQGRFQDAIVTLQQAAHLKPGNDALHYNLGQIYLRIGDEDAALRQYAILRTFNAEKAAQLYELISSDAVGNQTEDNENNMRKTTGRGNK